MYYLQPPIRVPDFGGGRVPAVVAPGGLANLVAGGTVAGDGHVPFAERLEPVNAIQKRSPHLDLGLLVPCRLVVNRALHLLPWSERWMI